VGPAKQPGPGGNSASAAIVLRTMRTLAVLAILSVGATACAGTTPRASAPTSVSASAVTASSDDFKVLGESGCQGQATAAPGSREVRGTGPGVEFWALVFAQVPITAGREVKIVWRMTGEGRRFHLLGKHTDGTRLEPAWGPQEHTGSSWNRPGDEWGAGFFFPKPGCWQIHATRFDPAGIKPLVPSKPISADAWFRVV
jgi:hypothetical protein